MGESKMSLLFAIMHLEVMQYKLAICAKMYVHNHQ